MKIFVTGATGLIGANSAIALLDAGHDLRLLVRDEAVARQWFEAQGYLLDDFVVADMLDKDAVKAGMQGCDAVLHSAAIVDLDARNAQKTRETNLQSIDSVIGSACELGINKILYVSSMSVFYDFSLSVLNETTPLADVRDAYSYSKKLCEERVRELQVQGHPIIATYPAMVLGPNDPKLAESNGAIIRFVTQVMPITSSGIQFIDARDVGLAHCLLLEAEIDGAPSQERYIIGGHYIRWAMFADMMQHAAGKRLLKLPIPGPVFRALGAGFDWVRQWVPINFPISREAMAIVTRLPYAESDKLVAKTDIEFRAPESTLSDTVAWLRGSRKL